MFKKSRKILLMGGVLAAVSFGGSALAAAGAAPVSPTHTSATATSPKAADAETADGTSQKAADTETSDGAETPDSGSEVSGNDGPGGHADEPGNPNAQHEAGGQTEE